MVIFSERWDGNEFFWGYHCYQWFFNGFATTEPSPLNVFFIDQPLASMVFQWFSPKSGTMVNNGFGPFKRHKKACNCHILNFLTNKLNDTKRRQMNLTDHVKVTMSFCRLKTKSKPFGLLRPQFTTIAKFQWFSKAPSPLNVWFGATIGFNGFSMVLGSRNHWFRWFTMVVHHWSNDGMVTYHRWSLSHFNAIND